MYGRVLYLNALILFYAGNMLRQFFGEPLVLPNCQPQVCDQVFYDLDLVSTPIFPINLEVNYVGLF